MCALVALIWCGTGETCRSRTPNVCGDAAPPLPGVEETTGGGRILTGRERRAAPCSTRSPSGEGPWVTGHHLSATRSPRCGARQRGVRPGPGDGSDDEAWQSVDTASDVSLCRAPGRQAAGPDPPNNKWPA